MQAHNRRMGLGTLSIAAALALAAWLFIGRGLSNLPSLAQAAEDAERAAEAVDEGGPTAQPTLVAQKKKKADHPFPRRRPAPEFEGGTGWINTSGPLTVFLSFLRVVALISSREKNATIP